MCPTRCDLEDPGIESQWVRHFPRQYKQALGLTQPPVQSVPGVFPRGKEAEVKERVKLHFYSPSGPSVASYKVNITLWYHV